MRTFAAIVLCLASCVRPDSVECADGSVCPRDRACWLIGEEYQCVTDDQVAACDGKADFSACAGGTCFAGVCLAPSCGDSRIGPIEVCDDGNTSSGDGCSPDCRSDETCGNGIVDLAIGEECDDGAMFVGLSHDGCSSTCLEEHPAWRLLPDYDELLSGSDWGAVYDLERGRVLVLASALGQMHTLEIESGVWTDVSPIVSPPERSGFMLAYDSSRRRVVMFGGLGFRDTWEWDGSTWLLQQPATPPPPRAALAMAYDAIGHRVVMFGGRSSLAGTQSEIADTWAWDGVEWTPITGPGPSKRSDAAMAFDPVRGVLVLYGGTSDTGDALGDTWELSGTTWTQRSSAVDPGVRRDHSMVFDPVSRKILAYGGRGDLPGRYNTTFAWDGTVWSQVANDLNDIGGQKLVELVHERRVLQLAVLGIYEWNGGGWTRLFAPALGGMRRGRVAAAADLDGRQVLVFGGLDNSVLSNATDLWRGVWMRRLGSGPPARSYSAMAYDPVRREFVLFGGQGAAATTLGDTWVFDAAGTWTQRTPVTSPSARSGHSMIYDTKRRVVVLFGGSGNSGLLGDTWTWDGTTWTEVFGTGPSPRETHSATYDPIRDEMVVFGGYGGTGAPPFGDTWGWNGAWTKHSDTGPSPRFSTATAWDAGRRRIVLFGGHNGANSFNDVWEWDGSTWTQVAATSIAAREGHALVPSLDGAGVMRFGIDNALTGTRDEVAQLRWTAATPEEVCVVGKDGDGDAIAAATCGGGDPDCWRICTPLCPPGTSCPATAIGCGDGACSPERENCLSCPEDCGACPASCGDLACNGGETHATCAADCP